MTATLPTITPEMETVLRAAHQIIAASNRARPTLAEIEHVAQLFLDSPADEKTWVENLYKGLSLIVASLKRMDLKAGCETAGMVAALSLAFCQRYPESKAVEQVASLGRVLRVFLFGEDGSGKLPEKS